MFLVVIYNTTHSRNVRLFQLFNLVPSIFFGRLSRDWVSVIDRNRCWIVILQIIEKVCYRPSGEEVERNLTVDVATSVAITVHFSTALCSTSFCCY